MTKKYLKNSNCNQIVTVAKKITTIHGTSLLVALNGKDLKLWIAIMLANVVLMISFIFVIKDKFNENQIVTQVNANCKVNQVPFPAVSICNFNMVSLKESQNIAKILTHYNKTEEEIQIFFNALPILVNYNKGSLQPRDFAEIMAILKHHYFTMDTIMEETHQKCENLLLYCTFNRKQKNCDEIFSLIKTYAGYCCAFNYAGLNDVSEMPLIPTDQDMEYYSHQFEDAVKPVGGMVYTSESGRRSGLTVVINVEPDDYPNWLTVPYYGAKVLISDPNDYPETRTRYRYITLGESVDIKVEPMIFQSEASIRRVNPEKRACWFHDEVVLSHTDIYSYETCHTECKMKNYLETCGCLPFKYPREKSTRICEFEDLKCLHNYTVYMSKKDMHCKPLCYMECGDELYTVTSDVVPFLQQYYPHNVTKDRNLSELAALQVYFGRSNCNCYKLTLLIDINQFIATYGGVFSIFFGGSIITLCEILYLLISFLITATAKTCRALRKNKRAI